MTEKQWEISCDPVAMLAVVEDRLNDRQKRLFAAACCRRLNDYMKDSAQPTVSVLEAFTEGRVTAGDLYQAHRNLSVAVPNTPRSAYHTAQALVEATAAPLSLPSFLRHAALSAGHKALEFVFRDTFLDEPSPLDDDPYRSLLTERCQDEAFIQAILLRDFTGDPFRPSPISEEWRNPTVMALAREIHTNRNFFRFPKLATALEQAGCTEATVLEHCRDVRMHTRGCWLLEGLLRFDREDWPNLDLSPFGLLEWLWQHGRVSERKLRLFGLACFRKAALEIPDMCREGLEVTERFADGEAAGKELWDAEEKITCWVRSNISDTRERAARVAGVVAGAVPLSAATVPLRLCWREKEYVSDNTLTFAEWVIAEILGNPFRPSVRYPWMNASVRAMADALYKEKDFASLPILADLLEDSGCLDTALIGHLRGTGPHVRGCWALDLLLDRH